MRVNICCSGKSAMMAVVLPVGTVDGLWSRALSQTHYINHKWEMKSLFKLNSHSHV